MVLTDKNPLSVKLLYLHHGGLYYKSDNLKLVPKDIRMKVSMPSRSQLFQGLENAKGAVPEVYWDCIYEMVRERVEYVKKL